MKYNVYDGIDSDEYNYCQDLALAQDVRDVCLAAAYYERIEIEDNILDLLV